MPDKTDMTQELFYVKDLLRWAVSRFTEAQLYFGHGTNNAYDEALGLIAHFLHLPIELVDTFADTRITEAERALVLQLIETRCHERIPLAYLTNEAWFAGLPFTVDERVIIPRSPIAELIDRGFQPWLSSQPTSVLDLCAGSGCIGIACAIHLGSQVDLVELSPEALALAEHNIQRHQLTASVKAIESDLFARVDGRYDLIVSNPPYVDAEDLASMPAEYHHEPVMALAAGTDGLDIARKILAQSADYLTEQGVLVLEVGNSDLALEKAFPSVPFLWLEFARGGNGVCVITRQELLEHFT
ncbi:MAG: 50S ribosomal protein L3 N(5)-glutamine methyltransferase [Pseudomonadota bacterium]|nr:50S ribosomal protein L3 N(5)-glutamine methyltransferase [Pseudomonadota bacterium]